MGSKSVQVCKINGRSFQGSIKLPRMWLESNPRSFVSKSDNPAVSWSFTGWHYLSKRNTFVTCQWLGFPSNSSMFECHFPEWTYISANLVPHPIWLSYVKEAMENYKSQSCLVFFLDPSFVSARTQSTDKVAKVLNTSDFLASPLVFL